MSGTLWLITARGGSKGLPGKNLAKIGGLSLIGWKANTARVVQKHYQGDSRLIISTDSREIADEARLHGVEVPFMRPSALATDTAKSDDVIKHALDWIEKDEGCRRYTSVVLLEPSSPFATPEQIHEAFVMYQKRSADLVVGMRRTEPHSVFLQEQTPDGFMTGIIVNMTRFGHGLGGVRRQDLKPEWTMNGALYVFDWRMFRETGSLYGGPKSFGVLMDRWHSIEIDTPHDLELALYAYKQGYVTRPSDDGHWEERLKQFLEVPLVPVTAKDANP